MFLFNKREIYNGNSIKESARIRDILSNHDIPYRIKIGSHLGQWTGRGAVRSYTGNVGNNPELDRQTIIYVQKQDYEKAMHFMQAEKDSR